jgi:carboxypeptidase C (cathepsin A)
VEFEPCNDLPYALYLPTYAATAWYHGLLPNNDQLQLRDILEQAELFAEREYHAALFQGTALTPAQRAALAETLARLTGLTPAYLEQTNHRVEIFRFTKELLRTRRRTVGRLDSRFIGRDRDAAGERPEHDPSYTAVQGAYTGAFNSYVRQDLNFASDLPYEVLSALYENWDFSKHQNRYVDVTETLRAALTQNPFLRVLVASGYYDLATPYFATRYTINHLGLEPELQDNIRMTYYEAGHMMYVHEPSLAQLRADLAGFVQETLSAGV